MKVRANNLLIGTVALGVVGAALIAHLVVQKIRSDQQRTPLRIVFEGSASGLRKGGNVNFDGIQAGQIVSLKLDNPRKVVALVMLDRSAPVRSDTVVGIEFQGLTGVADISLIGGAPGAPPVPVDTDGVPILTADVSDNGTIRDTLHQVDRVIVENEATVKDALLSFESYTASLKSKSDALDSMIGKADDAFAGFDKFVSRIGGVIPGLVDGKADELFQKVQSIREFADDLKHRSATFMEEGRRTLLDISEAANNMGRKLDPNATPPESRKPNQKRQ